jgi:hypothetical protein
VVRVGVLAAGAGGGGAGLEHERLRPAGRLPGQGVLLEAELVLLAVELVWI